MAAVKSLDECLRVVGWLVFASTFVVAFGLIFECWEDFEVLKNAIQASFTNRSLAPLRYVERKVKLMFLGGILVTIGVFGELIFEHKTRDVEARLEVENEKVIAFLTGKASEADKKAKQLGIDLVTACLLYTSPSPRD